MTTPDTNQGGTDWASIIAEAGKGASSAMQGASANAGSRREAKEAKRRTHANLLKNQLNREQNLFNAHQAHGQDITDYKSQALQQLARGFINALQGSTGGYGNGQ